MKPGELLPRDAHLRKIHILQLQVCVCVCVCVCEGGGGGEDGENSVQGQFWWNGMWYGNEVGCGMSL